MAYAQVRISKRLADRVEKTVQKRKFGYKSTTALVQDAVKLHLRNLQEIDRWIKLTDYPLAVQQAVIGTTVEASLKYMKELMCVQMCLEKFRDAPPPRDPEAFKACVDRCRRLRPK